MTTPIRFACSACAEESVHWGTVPPFVYGEDFDLLEKRAAAYELQASRLASRVDLLTAALQGIAANTCCGSCQEAALVARKALGFVDEAGEISQETWDRLSPRNIGCRE